MNNHLRIGVSKTSSEEGSCHDSRASSRSLEKVTAQRHVRFGDTCVSVTCVITKASFTNQVE